MKKHLIKPISIVLVLVLSTLTMSSCGLVDYIESIFGNETNNTENESKDTNSNKNDGLSNGVRNENSHYYSVKTLYSYKDVMDALEIVKERYNVKPTYTVDNMGENYTVFYHFWVGHCWTEYPIDYETYFTTKSFGSFNTYIFMENQKCPGHENPSEHAAHSFITYEEEEDYEKLNKYYKENACIWMTRISKNVVEIEDRDLLTYRGGGETGLIYYSIYYENKEIMDLQSCVKLDEAFFDDFFNSLVTTRVSN